MADDEMSKIDFRVSFDGAALAGHTMNVRDLAPSLIALGDMISEANMVLNGKDARAELHLTPNVEHGCIDVGLQINQQWETIKTLLGDDDVVTAKSLIELMFMGATVAGTTVSSLVYLYRKVRKRKPINVVPFNDEFGNRLYRYQYDGENDEIIDEKLHLLYNSNKIRRLMSRLLAPILRKEGVEDFLVYLKDKAAGCRVTKSEAKDFDFDIPEPVQEDLTDGEPHEVTLRVYSPVYDTQADKWRFWLGDKHHYMDVSESNIRKVVLENGGALIEDEFRVMLQIDERPTESGEPQKEYKVLEVVEFIPAMRQPDMFIQSVQDEPRQRIKIEDD